MVYCPACEADLDLDEEQLEEGGVVSCADCGAHFEVVSAHPLELERVDEDDEDEEDEDEDDVDEDEEDDDDDDDDGLDGDGDDGDR